MRDYVFSSSHNLAEHVGQDAAMAQIVCFDRGVNAQQHALRLSVLAAYHERDLLLRFEVVRDAEQLGAFRGPVA